MRAASTSNEAKLWALLQGRNLQGLKFRRQVPIGPYIVDFACLERRLVVEADGPFHTDADIDRDAVIARHGFQGLRFPNEMIAVNVGAVLAAIAEAASGYGAAGATPHPTRFAGHLLPQGEKDST
jgi:very-short-patch-repair endonuclease